MSAAVGLRSRSERKLPVGPATLAPLLCGVVFTGEPALGDGFNFQRVGLGAMRSAISAWTSGSALVTRVFVGMFAHGQTMPDRSHGKFRLPGKRDARAHAAGGSRATPLRGGQLAADLRKWNRSPALAFTGIA